MTPLALYFKNLDPATRRAAKKWFASRPPAVRAVAEQFPPGMNTRIDGKPAYLVGYSETADGGVMLQLSHTDPSVDYGLAVRSKFLCCPSHFRVEVQVDSVNPISLN